MDNEKTIMAQWVDAYAQKLYNRAFYLLSDQADAEDVVQDVFVAAFEKMDRFRSESTPLTWLMGILHHKVADYYRRKYKHEPQVAVDAFFDENDFWKNPDAVLADWSAFEKSDDETLEEYLERCLEKLPPRWLILVKLTYLQEKKYAEICQETQISKTNYWKILQRSRLQLRACIEQHNIEP